MLFYFSLSLFFFAFTAIIVDRHIVRHWPTIVGGFCLLAAAFEPRGRTRTSVWAKGRSICAGGWGEEFLKVTTWGTT